MNQKYLILGAGMLMSLSASALTSPYTGSVAPTEGSGEFYLYNVESGRWLQNNSRTIGYWTTRAELYTEGIDVTVEYQEPGKYILRGKFSGDKAFFARQFYWDTNDTSVFTFTPVEMEGGAVAYRIADEVGSTAGNTFVGPCYMGGKDGNLVRVPVEDVDSEEYQTTWQLVSREERLKYLKENASAETPVNASWLIPGQGFANNDNRTSQWTIQNKGGEANWQEVTTQTPTCGYNAARRCLNVSSYMHYITIKDIPNGTYLMSLYGLCRPGELNNNDVKNSILNGTDDIKTKYFAGGTTAKMQSVSAVKSEQEASGWGKVADNFYVPTSSSVFIELYSKRIGLNPWIETVVTDGTLTLGVLQHEAGPSGTMFLYDDIQLRYVSENTEISAETKASMQAELDALTPKLDYLAGNAGYDKLIAQAKEGIKSNPSLFRRAALQLMQLVMNPISADKVAAFKAVAALSAQEGVDIKPFQDAIDENFNNLDKALRDLRYARRRNAAIRYDDIFAGTAPEAGKFYLYNVGQKQFLTAGSDWGTHAAVGYAGVEVELQAVGESGSEFNIYTFLKDAGNTQNYLNHHGYMDCSAESFKFVAVAGKTNVYNVYYTKDGKNHYMVYDPEARVDAGHGDETTVSTEYTGDITNNADAEWKLVTKAERIGLFAKATENEPVDATFMISNPNFPNVHVGRRYWTHDNTASLNIENNVNRHDYIMKALDTDGIHCYQEVANLPAGVYTVMVNGYYRNGSHDGQINNELKSLAYVVAQETGIAQQNNLPMATGPNEAESPLKNILEEDGLAPGEGKDTPEKDGVKYHVPDDGEQAVAFFRVGGYQNSVAVNKTTADSKLKLGVRSNPKETTSNWIVFDNFRLLYHGNQASTGVEGVAAEAAEGVNDGRIYNLQGIEVANPTTPGIYICNGKKFVVK